MVLRIHSIPQNDHGKDMTTPKAGRIDVRFRSRKDDVSGQPLPIVDREGDRLFPGQHDGVDQVLGRCANPGKASR